MPVLCGECLCACVWLSAWLGRTVGNHIFSLVRRFQPDPYLPYHDIASLALSPSLEQSNQEQWVLKTRIRVIKANVVRGSAGGGGVRINDRRVRIEADSWSFTKRLCREDQERPAIYVPGAVAPLVFALWYSWEHAMNLHSTINKFRSPSKRTPSPCPTCGCHD